MATIDAAMAQQEQMLGTTDAEAEIAREMNTFAME